MNTFNSRIYIVAYANDCEILTFSSTLCEGRHRVEGRFRLLASRPFPDKALRVSVFSMDATGPVLEANLYGDWWQEPLPIKKRVGQGVDGGDLPTV